MDISDLLSADVDMTPIKIRGKRAPRRRIVDEALDAKRQAPLLGGLRSPLVSPSPANHPHYPPQTYLPVGVSLIERLPIELLEIIFWHCPNVSLPRASPILGHALSSFHVKSQLVGKLFSSNPGHGLQRSNLHETFGRRHSHATLQSDLLKTRWMTMDFWRQYMPIFLEKTIMSRFKAFDLDWMDGTPANRITKAMVAELMQAAYQMDRERNPSDPLKWEWQSQKNGKICLILELQRGIVELKFWKGVPPGSADGSLPPPLPFEMLIPRRWAMLNCVDLCRIPEKLLHGPWTEAKCQFLEMIVLSGASIDWCNSTSGEIAEWGLLDALKEQNSRALRALLLIELIPHPSREIWHPWHHHIYPSDPFQVPQFFFPQQHQLNMSQPPRTWSRSGVGALLLRPSHLVFAVVHQDCPLHIVELLLQHRRHRTVSEDPTLIEWAVQKRTEGDERGSWLLEKLRQYPGKPMEPREELIFPPSLSTLEWSSRALGRKLNFGAPVPSHPIRN